MTLTFSIPFVTLGHPLSRCTFIPMYVSLLSPLSKCTGLGVFSGLFYNRKNTPRELIINNQSRVIEGM